MQVEAAAAVLEETSADGPARATWYDVIVEGALAAAQSLAIPLMIGGDRDRNPHDTPFVRLIMGLESLLPSGTQSPSMAASPIPFELADSHTHFVDLRHS